MHVAQNTLSSSDNKRCSAGVSVLTYPSSDTDAQANARVSVLDLSKTSGLTHGVDAARQAAGKPGLELKHILSWSIKTVVMPYIWLANGKSNFCRPLSVFSRKGLLYMCSPAYSISSQASCTLLARLICKATARKRAVALRHSSVHCMRCWQCVLQSYQHESCSRTLQQALNVTIALFPGGRSVASCKSRSDCMELQDQCDYGESHSSATSGQ